MNVCGRNAAMGDKEDDAGSSMPENPLCAKVLSGPRVEQDRTTQMGRRHRQMSIREA